MPRSTHVPNGRREHSSGTGAHVDSYTVYVPYSFIYVYVLHTYIYVHVLLYTYINCVYICARYYVQERGRRDPYVGRAGRQGAEGFSLARL